MKFATRLCLLTLGLGLAATSFAAQDANEKAIKARQGEMQLRAFNAGPLFGMAKGQVEYDAALAGKLAGNLKLLLDLDNGRGRQRPRRAETRGRRTRQILQGLPRRVPRKEIDCRRHPEACHEQGPRPPPIGVSAAAAGRHCRLRGSIAGGAVSVVRRRPGRASVAAGRARRVPDAAQRLPSLPYRRRRRTLRRSEADFVRALRHGETPAGSHYYPAFPYTSYTRMTDEDARALFAYLRSQPASKRTNREHDLAWYLQWRLAAQAWKWLFFTPGEYRPDNTRSPAWNRGAYIAEALAHCGECHTPRNWFGAPNSELAYAGNPAGPDDELVPNITPDTETGIGDWNRDSLDLFLRFGELPNGEYTAGSMDYVITGIGKLTEADRAALIDYLRALPPIRNSVSN